MSTREVFRPHGALGRRGLESTSDQPVLFCSTLHSWSEQAKFALSFPVVKAGECGEKIWRDLAPSEALLSEKRMLLNLLGLCRTLSKGTDL